MKRLDPQVAHVDGAGAALPVDRAVAAPTTGEPTFAQWVAPSLLAMTRLARRLAASGDADDIVQEALTHAWRKWHQYDPARGAAQSWLLAITADRARAANAGRARRRRVVDDSRPPPDTAAPAHAQADQLAMSAAIATLTDRQQLAVNLHYFLGLPIDEAAAVLGCSPGTVKSTLFDARRKLRTLLGDDDDD
jgi:RNA polymerase sigma factor (sigma-70 family)